MPAIGLILANWKPIAIALALLGVVAYRGVLVHQRNTARAQAAALASQIADLKGAEAACEAAVSQQNQQVMAMRSAGERLAAATATREANVSATAALSAARENDRATQALRAPIAADCASAIKWGNAQAPELGKW